jgi:mannitol-1-phosphate 5-dehydrogenase
VKKSVVQFGAGSIGRGFTAQLFADAAYEVVFVDVIPEVIAALNERQAYPIRLVGPRVHETRMVRGVRAVDGRNEEGVAAEVADAALACTAVGVAALPHVAPALARGLRLRAEGGAPPLNVILCENQLGASGILREAVRACLPMETGGLADRTGFVEAVVSRMVPLAEDEERAADLLAVRCEDYSMLPVDADAFAGPIPAIPGLALVRNFRAHVERKLYTHNMGHAVAAYLGYQRGYAFIHEVIADAEILAATRGAMEEASSGLVARHRFSPEEQAVHVQDLLLRFANPELRDTVGRVGRDPIRKLRRDDRLVGAALLALEYGIEPRHIVRGIVAALRFDPPGDAAAGELQWRLAADGLDAVLQEVSGLAPGSPLAGLIHRAY